MRKMVILIAAIGLVLIPVTSAQAQTTGLRDPFDPLLSVEAQGGTTTGTPTGTGTDVDDPTDGGGTSASPTDDELPGTGAEPMNWLAAAYVLVAVGAGFLVAARLLRPGAAIVSTIAKTN